MYCGMLCLLSCRSEELPENYGKADGRLYVGSQPNEPLIVGLGGSEGGNAWDSDRWKTVRDQFLAEGYAFLALEYFGGPTTPKELDRISLEGVHNAILQAAKNPKINPGKICLVGGSKGAELALLLASKYKDISCVVGIVPSHTIFPALTLTAETSSWTYQEKEIDFVPMPFTAVPAAITGDLRKAFTIMLEDTVAADAAAIQVESINGPVLLVSASRDEMWPSSEMSEKIMARLKGKHFQYPYEHIAIEGGHTEPLKHFDKILTFLRKNWPSEISNVNEY